MFQITSWNISSTNSANSSPETMTIFGTMQQRRKFKFQVTNFIAVICVKNLNEMQVAVTQM
jgi:hypothetical protein